MRYVALLAVVLSASQARADHLATTVSVQFNAFEFSGGGLDRIWILTERFFLESEFPIGPGLVGVVHEYAADFPASPITVSNVILETKNPDRYYFRAEFPVVGPVGTNSYTSTFWTTTEVVRHLATSGDPNPFTRATWTLDSFTREPWPDISQNFATNFHVTGRYYVAVPEPASFVMLLVGLVHVAMGRSRSAGGRRRRW